MQMKLKVNQDFGSPVVRSNLTQLGYIKHDFN